MDPQTGLEQGLWQTSTQDYLWFH